MDTDGVKHPFWMPDNDLRGRPIPPELREVARRFWPQAMDMAQRHLGDVVPAQEAMEKAVYAIVNVMSRNGNRESIRNLDAYFYWAFVRRLTRLENRQKLLCFVESFEECEIKDLEWHPSRIDRFERGILFKQVLSLMDSRTRWMYMMKSAGHNWEVIGSQLNVDRKAAAVLFHQGLQRVRKKIEGQKPKDAPKKRDRLG
jgi:hypothetical protein